MYYHYSTYEAALACVQDVKVMCSNGFYLQLSQSIHLSVNMTMGMCKEPVCYPEVAVECIVELNVEVEAAVAAAEAGTSLLPIKGAVSPMALWAIVCG